ncbi:NADH oxidase [subsurface metagenome]|jgi:2,4-dienoyl-CoA reductase-like NADH-dependent reductase (Old Yellow Enzyme family)/thioredoxin reductase
MKILTPIKINKLELKNRIVMAPMSPKFASYNGEVTDRLINYYEARAKGKVGLIISGFAYIDNEASQVSAGQLNISTEKALPGLNLLVETIQKYNCKMFIQLCHGGRQSHKLGTNRFIVAPSSIPSTNREIPKELSITEIEKIVNNFAKAALRAKNAGFDGIELHGAHGYLINQFLSDYTNRRKDKYGGSLFSRMTFLLEIIRKTRILVGKNYIIGVRISGNEHVESFDEKTKYKGITPEVAVEISKNLEKESVDYIHVSAGIRETYEYMTPPIYLPNGNNVPFAFRIKKNVSIPVMVAGGINDPVFAEEILISKKADFVSVGRALIADPNFVKKIEENSYHKIRRCIRCNECVYRAHTGKSIKCAVNPEIGEENKKFPEIILKKKETMIVGGGPAGLQCSLLLNERNYSTILYEKLGYLGGKLVPASKPIFKKEIRNYLEFLISSIHRNKSIKIELNKEVNYDFIHDNCPDILIIATGSSPFIPPINNIHEFKNVFFAEDVLLNPYKIEGENILIIGGGKVGCETGVFLTKRGKRVTVIEMQSEILIDENIRENRVILLNFMKSFNIQTLTKRKLIGLKRDYIELLNMKIDKKESIKYDSLVFATGYVKNDHIYNSLISNINIPFFKIGDVANGNSIYHAIHQASSLINLL